jgi:methionine synthase II (cobalamin-independent)
VPKGEIVALGLITTKVETLESEQEILRRIDEAARYLPLERLALNSQCGFAPVKEGNLITVGDQRRKLELVAKVAEKVWKQ